jgi:hypothetical protein
MKELKRKKMKSEKKSTEKIAKISMLINELYQTNRINVEDGINALIFTLVTLAKIEEIDKDDINKVFESVWDELDPIYKDWRGKIDDPALR